MVFEYSGCTFPMLHWSSGKDIRFSFWREGFDSPMEYYVFTKFLSRIMQEKNIIKGYVTYISDLIQIRRTSKPDIFKKTIDLITEDQQKVFIEIRNTGIKELEREGISKGSYVEIEYLFEGSEKGGKKYNNIVLKSIKLLTV